MPTVTLTADEVEMLLLAIDSHIYWQLSEPLYRRDGDVMAPGSDVAEDVEQIEAYRALEAMLTDAPGH
jgi:hypothetical protein